jgi:hypothetical protein
MEGAQDQGNGGGSLEPIGSRRRDQVVDADAPEVTFTTRTLAPEKLDELRRFLAQASAAEVAMVRTLYGDMPEVLQWIARELASPSSARSG